MKKGSAGDDILGDLGDDENDVDDEPKQEKDQNAGGELDVLEGSTESEPEPEKSQPANLGPFLDDDSIVGDPPQTGADDSGVPWVYTRSNVKQDREMVQFYLRDFVEDAESDFVDAVSEEIGAEISKTDVREAAYVAAMRDVDTVVDELERWGFESSE
ncbi:hypothetical protein [Halomontanus rarus]|uniref:hypothetical protein n=1 Tax=Halomontanus rarus TaxID=3034020 RepID=UPI00293BF98B|nr:hypothetical protein [Halovivax sp. KZCA124]